MPVLGSNWINPSSLPDAYFSRSELEALFKESDSYLPPCENVKVSALF